MIFNIATKEIENKYYLHFLIVYIDILTLFMLLSITSLIRLRSSRAVSQFCIRISDASLPQRAGRQFLSVGGNWKKIIFLSGYRTVIKISRNLHLTKDKSFLKSTWPIKFVLVSCNWPGEGDKQVWECVEGKKKYLEKMRP